MTTRQPGVQGITLIEMMIVVLLIGIIAAIVIPKLTESRLSANESSAIGSMKAIATVQTQFREADSEQDDVQDFAASLNELSNANLLDNVLSSGTKSGYVFYVSGSTYEWVATATPTHASTGKRSFYVDVQGVVRYAVNSVPDSQSPPVGQ